MKQSKIYIYGLVTILGYLPIMSYADNAWSGYSGVERRSSHQLRHLISSLHKTHLPFQISVTHRRHHPKAIIINRIKIIIILIQAIDRVFVLNTIQKHNMSTAIDVNHLLLEMNYPASSVVNAMWFEIGIHIHCVNHQEVGTG